MFGLFKSETFRDAHLGELRVPDFHPRLSGAHHTSAVRGSMRTSPSLLKRFPSGSWAFSSANCPRVEFGEFSGNDKFKPPACESFSNCFRMLSAGRRS